MNRQHTSIAEPITHLQRQLEQIRSTQPPRSRLPESLWADAVGLERQYGVYRVAHTLRLDYVGLKNRLNGVTSVRTSGKTAFVELVPPPSPMPE